jgi:hypothetical protein
MNTHGPSCLPGPVTRERDWWSLPAGADSTPNTDAPVRQPLVERVRREIAAGTYDTPERFEAALERLLHILEDE